jgi:hypothetical protein
MGLLPLNNGHEIQYRNPQENFYRVYITRPTYPEAEVSLANMKETTPWKEWKINRDFSR